MVEKSNKLSFCPVVSWNVGARAILRTNHLNVGVEMGMGMVTSNTLRVCGNGVRESCKRRYIMFTAWHSPETR